MRDRRVHLLLTGVLLASIGSGATLLHGEPAQVPNQTLAAPRPAVAAKGNGFLLGQVVDATSGQPVGGAIVTLVSYGALPGGIPGSGQAVAPVAVETLSAGPPQTVIADSQGRFFFRELAGGRFTVNVTALGFLPGGYLQKKPLGTVHFVDLAADQRLGSVKITLFKHAAISGTVLDEAGEPVIGVTVRTHRRVASNSGLRLLPAASAVTDDRGVYRLSSLVAGDYLVSIAATQTTMPAANATALLSAGAATTAGATGADSLPARAANLLASGVTAPAPGFRIGDLTLQVMTPYSGHPIPSPSDDNVILAYGTTFYPGTPTSTQATAVTIVSGEERTGIDLSLRLVKTVRVSGMVVDPQGPVGNIGVKLLPMGADDFTTEVGIEAATTSADERGTFTFLGVPAGDYTLRIVKSATRRELLVETGLGTPVSSDPRGTTAADVSAQPTWWAAQPVSVGNADITGLSVTLRPGLRISGRVEFSGSKPAPGAVDLVRGLVNITPVGARSAVIIPSGRVGADGQFSTAGYPAGKYFVGATMPISGWTLLSIMQGNRNVADEPLDIDAADITDLVVTFTDRVTELSGTVVDANGTAATTSEIIVFPADSQTWKQGVFGTRRLRLSPVTKAGTYAIGGLPPGDYFVAAMDEGATADWQRPAFLERLQSSATRVSLQAGEKKTQALTLVVLR